MDKSIALQLLVNIGFQVLFHSPPGVLFTFPSLYCFTIGHQVVFRLGGWSPRLPSRFHVSRSTLDPAGLCSLSYTGLSPPMADFPNVILLARSVPYAVRNPQVPKYSGLASAHFARRYFGYRCFFLFLPLLRCFSSGRSPRMTMDSSYADKGFPCRVSPFGHPRIDGYLHLPVAFRSLSRPSSAPGAKASSLRSFLLDLALLSFPSCSLSVAFRASDTNVFEVILFRRRSFTFSCLKLFFALV